MDNLYIGFVEIKNEYIDTQLFTSGYIVNEINYKKILDDIIYILVSNDFISYDRFINLYTPNIFSEDSVNIDTFTDIDFIEMLQSKVNNITDLDNICLQYGSNTYRIQWNYQILNLNLIQ